MQNRWVWTAGSKLGKSRGLNIKNWAFLELFLNYQNRGLIPKKPRDLNAKVACVQ